MARKNAACHDTEFLNGGFKRPPGDTLSYWNARSDCTFTYADMQSCSRGTKMARNRNGDWINAFSNLCLRYGLDFFELFFFLISPLRRRLSAVRVELEICRSVRN